MSLAAGPSDFLSSFLSSYLPLTAGKLMNLLSHTSRPALHSVESSGI